MDYYLYSCGGDASVHLTDCDFWQLINEEGTNGESSMNTLDGGPSINYEHPTGPNEVIDGGLMSMPAPNTSMTFLDEIFDDGANTSYPSLAAPALPSINNQFPNFDKIFFPLSNSASTDTTSCSTATEPHPTALLLPQTVGSNAMRTVSRGRLKKSTIYACHFPGCTASFTAQHNYKCPYFFIGNISSN